MTETVLEAVEKANAVNYLDKCVSDLGWTSETLALEMMSMILNWEDGDNCMEMRQLLMRIYAGSSTTKECLESVFAWLTDISSRQSKNKRFSCFSTWFYSSSCPYSAEGGMPQVRPARAEPFLENSFLFEFSHPKTFERKLLQFIGIYATLQKPPLKK